jgi:hypothetical protein
MYIIKKNLLIASVGLLLSISFSYALSSSVEKEFLYQDSTAEKYKK